MEEIAMSKKLGKLVREARTAKNLTQAALAEQVEGLTSSEIGKIERGESEPSQEVLKRMAKVLGVTQKSLLEAAGQYVQDNEDIHEDDGSFDATPNP